jgi:hypothetical protein
MQRPLAIATALLSLTALATAASEEWLSLDSALEELAGEVRLDEDEGVDVGLYFGAFWAHSSDDVATGGGPDLSGLRLGDADVWFEARADDARARVSLDLDTGVAVLEDAYMAFPFGEDTVLHRSEFAIGQFKPRILRSASMRPSDLFFVDRSLLGARFDRWDRGVQWRLLRGEFEWHLAVVNGADGLAEDLLTVVRMDWDVYGEVRDVEGARDAESFLGAVVGASYFSDASNAPTGVDDGWAADLAISLAPYSLFVEYADLENNAGGPATGIGGPAPALMLTGASSPYAFGGSWALDEDWELGVRFQQLDDALDTSARSFAAKRMLDDAGTNFVVELTDYASDGPEGLVIQAGFRLAAGR